MPGLYSRNLRYPLAEVTSRWPRRWRLASNQRIPHLDVSVSFDLVYTPKLVVRSFPIGTLKTVISGQIPFFLQYHTHIPSFVPAYALQL